MHMHVFLNWKGCEFQEVRWKFLHRHLFTISKSRPHSPTQPILTCYHYQWMHSQFNYLKKRGTSSRRWSSACSANIPIRVFVSHILTRTEIIRRLQQSIGAKVEPLPHDSTYSLISENSKYIWPHLFGSSWSTLKTRGRAFLEFGSARVRIGI